MAENPGLENHRIKSFKNKGRDVEVSVFQQSGPSRLAVWPRQHRSGGERRVAVAGAGRWEGSR